MSKKKRTHTIGCPNGKVTTTSGRKTLTQPLAAKARRLAATIDAFHASRDTMFAAITAYENEVRKYVEASPGTSYGT